MMVNIARNLALLIGLNKYLTLLMENSMIACNAMKTLVDLYSNTMLADLEEILVSQVRLIDLQMRSPISPNAIIENLLFSKSSQ